MNIIPPIPNAITFNNGVVNNESARRDNTLKETIPALGQNESSGAEKGLGSESDRAKAPGQAPAPLTYERPQSNSAPLLDGQSGQQKDNASDQSAGREDAQSRQQQQQQEAQKSEINELKQRDLEVKSHEQAHASIGGQYAASPQYEYTAGPDGRRYAVDGEVSIDISEGTTPEETIRKMQQVKAAALAPAEPSAQDLRVAAEATQKTVEARNEIAQQANDNAVKAFEKTLPENLAPADKGEESSELAPDAPSLSEITDNIEISVPSRTLESEDLAADQQPTEEQLLEEQIALFNANRDQNIVRRLAVIQDFYQQVTTPRTSGFEQSA